MPKRFVGLPGQKNTSSLQKGHFASLRCASLSFAELRCAPPASPDPAGRRDPSASRPREGKRGAPTLPLMPLHLFEALAQERFANRIA